MKEREAIISRPDTYGTNQKKPQEVCKTRTCIVLHADGVLKLMPLNHAADDRWVWTCIRFHNLCRIKDKMLDGPEIQQTMPTRAIIIQHDKIVRTERRNVIFLASSFPPKPFN